MALKRVFMLFVLALATAGFGLSRAADGESSGKAAETQIPQRAVYLVGVGDGLEVNVWKNPDFSRKVLVRPDGRITLPVVGDLQAEGKSLEDLTKTITEKLKDFLTDPVVTVSLDSISYAVPSKRSEVPELKPEEGKRPPYRIGVEDVLDVAVWKNPDLSRQVWVRPDGRISLPLAGELVAEGLTTSELAKEVQGRLSAYFADPVVTVGLVEINSNTIYIMGMVKSPGPQKLRSPRTFLQVLTMAGGFQEFADSGSVSIIRWEGGKQKRIPVDAKKIISKGTEADFYLHPGDVIIVP